MKAAQINTSPKYQDLWAAVLFWLHLIAFGIISAYYASLVDFNDIKTPTFADPSTNPSSSSPSNSPYGIPRNNNGNQPVSFYAVNDATTGSSSSPSSSVFRPFVVAIYVLGSTILALLTSSFYLYLLQKVTTTMIWISLTFNVVIWFVLAGASFFSGNVAAGVIMAILGVVMGIVVYSIRSLIPLAQVFLKTVSTISRNYSACMTVSLFGSLLSMLYTTAFIACVFFVSQVYHDQGSKFALVSVFALFSLYWTSQTIKSWVHVTVSGLFATVYFYGEADGKGSIRVYSVRNPTWESLKRASTTSFGSICFGSLLIAIIETIEAIVRSSKENARHNDNGIVYFLLACLECLIGYFRALFEYFNHYAFTQVAIYGKSFCEAAKDTWELMKFHGLTAVANDLIIDSVLGFAGIVVAFVVAVVVFLIGMLANVTSSSELLVCTIVGALLGFLLFVLQAEIIRSGVATTLVCLAEQPEALARTNADLYHEIRRSYPGVMI